MFQTYWLALGIFSTLLTFSWLFLRERVTVTSAGAFAGWVLMAYQGGSLEVVTNDGTTASVPATDEMRYLLFAFGLLSLLAFVLFRVGAYPPQTESPYENEVQP